LSGTACVPELWAREIANGLAVAYLRKRITSADEQAFLAALSHQRIDVEQVSILILATLDTAMRKAAEQSGIALFQHPWLLQKGWVSEHASGDFVVTRDWNFAKSGKPAAILQRLYGSEDPAKRLSQTEGNVS
jgi:hypothetical protein